VKSISIDVLPAERGDCLWVECARPGKPPWRLLIDGGMPSTWPLLRARIENLAAPVTFDLAVVSHIDSDHIGGMLPLLARGDVEVRVDDVWFNGLTQLPKRPAPEVRSAAQGKQLMELLSEQHAGRWLPWNEHFSRAAVMTGGDGKYETIDFPDGPRITLLSPTPRRLLVLRKVWETELQRLQRGEPEEEETAMPMPLDDLAALAAIETPHDRSPANGSSIAFLLEYAGRRCLFAADAFSSVLGTALTSLANGRDGNPIALDVFKLPHHGSKGSVTADLLKVVPAEHYIVSTNGDRFHHPDDIALARVVTGATRPPTIWFNYACDGARRWSDPALQAKYRFATHQPAGAPGIRIDLAEVPP
jgi:beta-lactamase superfamily II metal-dependent hydrolase